MRILIDPGTGGITVELTAAESRNIRDDLLNADHIGEDTECLWRHLNDANLPQTA